MTERVSKVSNPLTIIAIFAALAEVSGSVVLGLMSPELQKTFIWFVMIFPSAIVVIFFWILFQKHTVLYGPGDFIRDENFLALATTFKESIQLKNTEVVPPPAKDIQESMVDGLSITICKFIAYVDGVKFDDVVNDKRLKELFPNIFVARDNEHNGLVYFGFVMGLINSLEGIISVAAKDNFLYFRVAPEVLKRVKARIKLEK